MPLATALVGRDKAPGCGRPKGRNSLEAKAHRLRQRRLVSSDSDGAAEGADAVWLPPLDVPPALPPALASLRQRQLQKVARDLQHYDECIASPEPEHEAYESRRAYDCEIRLQAYSRVRRELVQEARWRSRGGPRGDGEAAPRRPPHIVLVLLLPVHIVKRERLRMLQHTLRSIRGQEPGPGNTEVILAASWYADPSLEGEVRAALAGLRVEGAANAPAAEVSVSARAVSHVERATVALVQQACWPVRRGGRLPAGEAASARQAAPALLGVGAARDHAARGRLEAEAQARERGRRGPPSVRLVPGPASRRTGYAARTERTEGTRAEPERGQPCSGPPAVLVQQKERTSQFEHLRAALKAAEAALHDRWAFTPDSPDRRSIWVMFGDDDDLWHPRRTATFLKTMQEHPLLECVGVFATFARANVEPSELAAGAPLPQSREEVDDFLVDGRATLNHEEEDASRWLEEWHAAGSRRAELLLPDGLNLEYFDFCPRLRVMREFFDRTTPELLQHRFCDLHCSEFLQRYNLRGRELGLELSYVESDTWLYFYANRGQQEKDWEDVCECDAQEECRPRAVGFVDGHVSSAVSVDSTEVHIAKNRWREFLQYDEKMTPSRLSRYLAHCRNATEMMLIRFHRATIDQRDFCRLVTEAASLSFVGYINMIDKRGKWEAENLMLDICTGIGKSVARRLEVEVIWRDPDRFLFPGQEPVSGASGENAESDSDSESTTALANDPHGHGEPDEAIHEDLRPGASSREESLADARVALARVPQKALHKWEQSGEANDLIRSFTVEAEWGEARSLSFEEVLTLLDHIGIRPATVRSLAGGYITEDEYANDDEMHSRALDVLREAFPEREKANCIPFQDVYRLCEVFNFSIKEFVKKVQDAADDEEDCSTWPLLSGFKVIRQIGKGMKSSVFLCKHARTGEQVALKWPATDDEMIMTAALHDRLEDSSGFARIVASGTHLRQPYMVTQLMGSDLAKVLGRLDHHSVDDKWDIIRVIGRILLRRLQALHTCGLVHCDLSPENIVLTRNRETQGIVPHLIDFGCARRFPGGGSVEGDHGAVEFSSVRSSEKCERRPEDDIEALGWLMVCGVVGTLPWFAWLDEYYSLKPALQKVKWEGLLERVREAKTGLLEEGLGSLELEGEKSTEVPPMLDVYMSLARQRPNYQKLAGLLGGQHTFDTASAETLDTQELHMLLEPIFEHS